MDKITKDKILSFMNENKGNYFDFDYLRILFDVSRIVLHQIIDSLLNEGVIKYFPKNNQSFYGI